MFSGSRGWTTCVISSTLFQKHVHPITHCRTSPLRSGLMAASTNKHQKVRLEGTFKNPQRLVQMVPYCLHSYKYTYILGLHTYSICGLLGQNPKDLKIIETRHQYFQPHFVAKKQPKSIPVTVWLVWGSSICMKRGHELCICHNVIGIWKLQVCHLQQKNICMQHHTAYLASFFLSTMMTPRPY